MLLGVRKGDVVYGPSWGIQLFFFALHLVSKNEITCSGLKGFRHPESCVCFCFGEEGENTEVWFGLVYASLRCFHG